MNNVQKKYGNITITVDNRTELLSIILILSDNYKNIVGNKMIPLENKYIYDRINKKFGKYKNHYTIKLFEEIISKHHYFNYDAPVTLFLSLDNNYKCSKLNDYLLNDILDKDYKIYDFINSLEQFACEIDYFNYYESNKEEYQKFIEEIYQKHYNNKIAIFLNEFFNMDSKKLYINAIPFNSMSCYSSFIEDRVYSNLGITQFSKKENLYKDWELIRGDMALVSLHEFCHSYINPLTKKYVNPNDFDFVIDDNMKKYAYDDALTIINENIVRTIVLYYESNNLDNVKYKNDYEKEIKAGYKYIEKIMNCIYFYEKNRNIYQNFEDVFLYIINSIKK